MTLRQLQTESGKFTIAAFDQRASLEKLLGINHLTEDGRKVLERMKSLFMEVFSPLCSAVLVDPDFGMPALEKKNERAGLLMSLEESVYTPEDPNTLPSISARWGVNEIVLHGGAVKLVMNYHPESETAPAKRALVEKIHAEARARNVPFLLEPILHDLESSKLSWVDAQLRMAEELRHACDVLKLEFPLQKHETFAPAVLRTRCVALTNASVVPWVLLSRGMGYEEYIRALSIAMKAGASGFAVGRAVWKEVGEFSLWEEQEQFVRTVARERMVKLIDLVNGKVGSSVSQ